MKNIYLALIFIAVASTSQQTFSAQLCSINPMNLVDGEEYSIAALLGNTPIPFVPLTRDDFVRWFSNYASLTGPNNKIGIDLVSNVITFDINGTIQEGNIDVWLARINTIEETLNQWGLSLLADDNTNTLDIWELYTDPKKVREQLLNNLKTKINDELMACAESILPANCPYLDEEFILANVKNVDVNIPIMGNQKIQLPNKEEMELQQIIRAANNTSKIFCALGFQFYSEIPRFTWDVRSADPRVTWNEFYNIDDFIGDMFGGLSRMLVKIGYSATDFNNPFTFSIQPVDLVFGIIKNKIDGLLVNLGLPTREQLHMKITQLKLALPAELQNIDINNIPTIEPAKYPKLELKKNKEWSGFNVGSAKFLAAYGNAGYAVYGSNIAQAAAGYAVVGTKILNKDIPIVGGTADFFAGPANMTSPIGRGIKLENTDGLLTYALIHFQFLSYTYDYDKHLALDGFTHNFPKQEFSSKIEYTQQFAIGPIPVNVTLGGQFAIGVSANTGLALTRVYGTVSPIASGSAFARAAVGVKGVLSGGAGADLNILSYQVPLQGSVELKFEKDGEPFLDLNIGATARISTLSGKAYAYAEYLVPKWGVPPWKSKRVAKTFYESPGEHWERSILNWGMELGRFGARMKGELIDQIDLAEADAFNNAIFIAEKAVALKNYQDATVRRTQSVFTDIANDLNLPEHQTITADAQFITNYRTALDKSIESYLCSLAALSNDNTLQCGAL